MSHAQVETRSPKAKKNDIKDAPYYTVPAILAILMLSSGAFFMMIAQGISIMAKTGY
ncbi:hypothetical protein [Demequina sp.]|uniref:hypothetical protein n=1 Tax=Demequina sp. TaxID=2050685 RepID=UPI0025B8F690|nr:hypothetical protein [Demequina sp.]